MQKLLAQLLEGASAEGIIELCLDFSVTEEYTPEKFHELAGLAGFKDLEILSVAQHLLESAKGLEGLSELKELNLQQNEIESLEELAVLPQLSVLDLSFNLLTSLKGFPVLPKLESLNLGHNHLDSLAGIEKQSSLKKMVLSGNRPLKTLGHLSSCSELRELYLKQLFLADWTFLKELPQLESLFIAPMNMESLPLDSLSRLKRLHITGKRMQGKVQLPPMPALEEFTLVQGSGVIEIQGWEGVPRLKRLELSKNGLTKAPELSHCPDLKYVDLRMNQMPLPKVGFYPQVEIMRGQE